jgi:hypothetical protein
MYSERELTSKLLALSAVTVSPHWTLEALQMVHCGINISLLQLLACIDVYGLGYNKGTL